MRRKAWKISRQLKKAWHISRQRNVLALPGNCRSSERQRADSAMDPRQTRREEEGSDAERDQQCTQRKCAARKRVRMRTCNFGCRSKR